MSAKACAITHRSLPPLIGKLLPELVDEIVAKLVSNMKSANEQLRDICAIGLSAFGVITVSHAIGLKSIFVELSPETPAAFQVCKRLINPLIERVAQVHARAHAC